MSISSERTLEIHVLAHTHWDREWYLPAARFRQRLVALIDELLDMVDGPPFLLDGQGIVLEDYLAVRPERAAELARRIQSGALEAGPWYVLADELIPGGEALVRNLLTGRRTLRAMRCEPPPVLYCPDSFGHPAALPSIAQGFGYEIGIVWRGLGGSRWPSSDLYRWLAADGAELVVHHLPREGYSAGANLPSGDEEARRRWLGLRMELAPRAALDLILVPNGADHHALQAQQEEAVDALARVASPDRVVRSSLRTYADAIRARVVRASIPSIRGELRDSYGYTWTLQGTFATRAAQKRRNARLERELVRDVEPWAALDAWHEGRSHRPLLNAAWRSLLRCHPHDTLCGCSIDEVARAMDARQDETSAQARGIRDDVLSSLLGHDPAAARTAPSKWEGVLVLRNRSARARGGVAEIELADFVQHVPVGPGSAAGGGAVPEHAPGQAPIDAHLQILGRSRRFDRVESPRHYPDNDLVMATRALMWVEPLGGYAVRAIPIREPFAGPAPAAVRVKAGRRSIANAFLELEVDSAGTISLRSAVDERTIHSLLMFECVAEGGDLYTHSPLGEPLRSVAFLGVRIVERGPLRASLEVRWRMAVPRPPVPAVRAPGERRSPWRERRRSVTIAARCSLDANAPFLRIALSGENSARNHRLRAVLATDVRSGEVHADAAFGPVERQPLVASEEDRAMEVPPPTAPLHRYVSRFDGDRGATLFSDGLAEYEALGDGSIAVTLVRAVGELSRNDLPERPGHAAWPAQTPEAQSLGPFAAVIGLQLHGGRSDETLVAVERSAEDFLLPLVGSTLRSALAVPPPVAGVTLHGDGLVFSACKESDDGRWTVIRCYNVLDRPVDGGWQLPRPPTEARWSRLDETPLDPLDVVGDTITFTAGPRAIVTVLVR